MSSRPGQYFKNYCRTSFIIYFVKLAFSSYSPASPVLPLEMRAYRSASSSHAVCGDSSSVARTAGVSPWKPSSDWRLLPVRRDICFPFINGIPLRGPICCELDKVCLRHLIPFSSCSWELIHHHLDSHSRTPQGSHSSPKYCLSLGTCHQFPGTVLTHGVESVGFWWVAGRVCTGPSVWHQTL